MRECISLSILLLLFYSALQVQSWNCSWIMDGSCFISNTTLTMDQQSTSGANGTTAIILNYVDIPDPSPELFARLLGGVQEFFIHLSTAAELHFPANLSELSIFAPLEPLHIIIDRNISYRLKKIKLIELTTFPKQIESLHSLEFFTCGHTQIPSFDFAMFSEMINLTEIDVINTSTNYIRIPQSLQLPSLRSLLINQNRITTLNAAGWNFPALEVLDLTFNQITSVPQYINTFGNLTFINLSKNFIQQIDMTVFTGMKQLNSLYLMHSTSRISSNGIVEIPCLKTLHLSDNNLTKLDVSFWHMPSLEHISLNWNHLQLVSGFSSSFTQGLREIYMFENPWNCTWLKQVGSEIKRMVVSELEENCNAYLHVTDYNQSDILFFR